MPAGFVRIVGDGLVYAGRCLVKGLVFWPDADADHVDVYDGVNTTIGKKFCRVEVAVSTTRHIGLGQGVVFESGIYIDGTDGAVETTVLFESLDI